MEKEINSFMYSLASDSQELQVKHVLPTKENIQKLMRAGKYFEEPGVLKIWLSEQSS